MRKHIGCDGRTNQEGRRLRNAQFLHWEWRRSRLCEDFNLGASANECRNKRLHYLMNVCVAEFKDVGGLTMRHDNDSYHHQTSYRYDPQESDVT